MKKLIFAAALISANCFAGSVGGSNPPAKEKLEEMMMLDAQFRKLDGGLFTTESGDIGLLSRYKLQPQMLVGSGVGGGTPPAVLEDGTVGGGGPPALRLSDSDVTVLRDRKVSIEAVSSQGGNLSFDIEAGNELDSVILKDRRLNMRESICNQ